MTLGLSEEVCHKVLLGERLKEDSCFISRSVLFNSK